MRNELQHIKTFAGSQRELILKQFHEVVAHPPEYNPFTSEGNEAWESWAETCRSYEVILAAEGINL